MFNDQKLAKGGGCRFFGMFKVHNYPEEQFRHTFESMPNQVLTCGIPLYDPGFDGQPYTSAAVISPNETHAAQY